MKELYLADSYVADPTEVIRRLEVAYRDLDPTAFTALLADESGAEFRFQASPDGSGLPSEWGVAEERAIHRRMFDPSHIGPSEPPLDPVIWVQSIHITLAQASEFVERNDLYYEPNSNPGGLDRKRWRAMEATYHTDVFFELGGASNYQVDGRAVFVVLDDLAKPTGAPRKFLIYRWEELGTQPAASLPSRTRAVEPKTWSAVKRLYSPSIRVDSEPSLVQALADAYRRLDYAKFTTLFANEDGAQYLFFLCPGVVDPTPYWGYTEEMRIHRRMFRPQDVLPGEVPVPPERWLASVHIGLTQMTGFAERSDLYRSDTNPQGLDRGRWRATEAIYRASVFFQLRGDFDYQIDGRENFVVIDDLQKPSGQAGKYLIYRWEDMGASPRASGTSQQLPWSPAVEPGCWGTFKRLYR